MDFLPILLNKYSFTLSSVLRLDASPLRSAIVEKPTDIFEKPSLIALAQVAELLRWRRLLGKMFIIGLAG